MTTNDTHDQARDWLRRSLVSRQPTYEVAHHILTLGLPLPDEILVPLGSLASRRHPRWTPHDDFDAVVPADRQVRAFNELFQCEYRLWINPQTAADGAVLRWAVTHGMAALGFKGHQPAEILAAHVRMSGSVRKRVRFLGRLADRAAQTDGMWRVRRAQMQAKSRLAYSIDSRNCDDLTLAYCAYLAARANRRSIFQIGSQSSAVDTVVEQLGRLLIDSPATNWLAVAHVRPTPDVIARLDAEAQGKLMARFHAEMTIAARELAKLWPNLPDRMRGEMVMVKGVDSSRWNAFAGALNAMRSAWINTVLALGLDTILDRYLPGKAPRLMASDVAWMYRNHGEDLHEDTRMFTRLAHPWDVVNGTATQGRAGVLAAAAAEKIDATGWVGPRDPKVPEQPTVEPALVHGVVVTDPEFAVTLRRCGVFSGKGLRHLDELAESRGIQRDWQIGDRGQLVPVAQPTTAPIEQR